MSSGPAGGPEPRVPPASWGCRRCRLAPRPELPWALLSWGVPLQGSRVRPPAGDLGRRARPLPPEVGAGLPEWRRGRGAADSAPACKKKKKGGGVESGWRRSLRLGGSENSANTCLEEGRGALEQLLLFSGGCRVGGKGAEALPGLGLPPQPACGAPAPLPQRPVPPGHPPPPVARGPLYGACSQDHPLLEHLVLLPNSGC